VDVWEAVSLANLHPRVDILRPGPGVGGHCISVDPWFLVEAAPDLSPLIRAARQVNDTQPQFVVELAQRALGLASPEGLAGKRLAVLGLSYKPDVDDLRESPAIEVAHLLVNAGASVRAFEPFKPAARIDGLQVSAGLPEALAGAELILLLVGHTQFKALVPAEVAQLTPARRVVDAINGWPVKEWQAAGFEIIRLGASTAKPMV
jgi:UDP-N-acetyl-D-mannosaminuronic acid dehydrogenase